MRLALLLPLTALAVRPRGHMPTIPAIATAVLCSALPFLATASVSAHTRTPQSARPATQAQPAPTAQDKPVNPAARTMVSFTERVDAYLKLQKGELAKLPKLKPEATPLEIDQHQRALGAAIAKARAGAKPGDVFTPDMQKVARELMQRVFANAHDRRELRDSVMDENPTAVRFKVNDRYPDAVPLSTMPPEVLQNLPRLPEGLEYRFVGTALILLDPDAHIVVDYVTRALPTK